MIDVRKITKRYGRKKVLDDVTFSVGENGIYGFLGPNGAGKTTLLKVLTGLKYPEKGYVKVFGMDLKENDYKIKKHIGYLPENTPLDNGMTVYGFLMMYASFKGLTGIRREEEVERVISICSLEKVRDKITETLSKGYRQRTGLAQALLNSPRIMLLDEPFSGLDPEQLVRVREIITLSGAGSIVIISSHNLKELELISNRVFIMNNGRLAAETWLPERINLEELYLKTIGSNVG